MTNKKKILMVPFGAVAALLTLASAAFACTAFLGSFTVTGDRGGSVTVNGKDTGPNGTFTMKQDVNSGVAKVSATGGSVTIATDVSTNGSKLPANTYTIRYYNSDAAGAAPGYKGTGTNRQWNVDCMSAPLGTKIGTTKVGSDGKISPGAQTTFNLGNILPLNTNPEGSGESALCITDSGAYYGNQAPFTVV